MISLERKIVPWNSHPVTIPPQRQSPAVATTHILSPVVSDDPAHKVAHNKFAMSPIHVPRQIIVPLSMPVEELVTTPVSRLLVIRPHFKCLAYRRKPTLTKVVDILLRQPFYVTASSFSHKAPHLPKHMVATNTERAPPTIYCCRQNPSNPAPIGAPKNARTELHRQKQYFQTPVTLSGSSFIKRQSTGSSKRKNTLTCRARTRNVFCMAGAKKAGQSTNTEHNENNLLMCS